MSQGSWKSHQLVLPDASQLFDQSHGLHVHSPAQDVQDVQVLTKILNFTPPALEDDQVGVAGPHHVGVVGSLLHVGRPQAVLALVEVLGEHTVQPDQGHLVLLLAEHGEDGDDVLFEEEVEGWLPELEDSVSVQAGVDAHRHIGLLHLGKRNALTQQSSI